MNLLALIGLRSIPRSCLLALLMVLPVFAFAETSIDTPDRPISASEQAIVIDDCSTRAIEITPSRRSQRKWIQRSAQVRRTKSMTSTPAVLRHAWVHDEVGLPL
jgi:hypothetical protein